MLREPLEFGLIDAHDDVAHSDPAALGRRLAREQLLDPHHAGAQGLVRDVLLPAEAEAQARRVLQQAHLKHVVCGGSTDRGTQVVSSRRLSVQIRISENYLGQIFHALK